MLSETLAGAIKLFGKGSSPLPKYSFVPGNDDTTKETGIFQDLSCMGLEDYKTLNDTVEAHLKGEEDDSNLLLERLVTLLAKLPLHSHEGKQLTDSFVNTLWGGLEHPPMKSVSHDTKYREPDGSNNNLHAPRLGAAGTPYARTTSPLVFQGPNLPEPEVIFDSVMSRSNGTGFKEHPNRISSTLFYLAVIITHDVFQTDPRDNTVNMTSSYLDLSPLYGRNVEEQNAMRTFKDGQLKPDCFSSKRLLGMPPGVGVFIIMFNRFHNYVVAQLARINEGGRFTRPNAEADRASWEKYDNDLFQTGRLITCGLYVNIILKDYVRTILNLNRTNSSWDLDPRTHQKKNAMNSSPAPEGTGNQVSVEFNLVYRWHSAMSKRDEDWTTSRLSDFLGGKDPAKATLPEMMAALGRYESTVPAEPEARPFAGLTRTADATYSDDDLVDILTASIEDVAGAFGANQVPSALRVIEVLGIKQARNWHCATLNEFRQHFHLKKHETFEDINPDPVVAAKLQALYDSPDSVELYPGIVAEKPKPPMSGSGLCVNFTTSRAILSDAVALVRGDRFYTLDYTPRNLTNWGYKEVDFDLEVNHGHVMHKLILRAFPSHFASNSIYAHFPMTVPQENKIIFDKLERSQEFSWARPKRDVDAGYFKSHKTITEMLGNIEPSQGSWADSISYFVSAPRKDFSKNFWLAGDDVAADWQHREHVGRCLYQPKPWKSDVEYFMNITTANLINGTRKALPRTPFWSPGDPVTFEADIIRDIIIPINTRFVAALWGLPIRTPESTGGAYSEHELYGILTSVFRTVFFDNDPTSSFKLRAAAREMGLKLADTLRQDTEAVAGTGWVSGVVSRINQARQGFAMIHEAEWPIMPNHGQQLILRLLENGLSVGDCINGTVLPMAAASATLMSSLLSQCLDYYLEDGSEHLPELRALAHQHTRDADDKLLHYLLEGIRLHDIVAAASSSGRPLKTSDSAISLTDSLDSADLPLGSDAKTYPKLRLKVVSADDAYNAEVCPNPEMLKLDRPLSAYLLRGGAGPHRCLNEAITRTALAAAFKVLVGLPGIRRAPGPRGMCKSLASWEWRGQTGRAATMQGARGEWAGLREYMTADESKFSPVPTTMKVRWEGIDTVI